MNSADWSLAFRNLLRNRRRSLSTVAALAIGLAAILLFSGFKANLGYTMLTAYVRAGGHMQIQHRDYYLYGSGNPTAYGISDYQGLVEAIRKDPVLAPLLAVATPMLRFGGLAGNFDAGISRTVIGTGYVAADVQRMRTWNEYQVPITRPQFPLEGAPPEAAIVGIGVARVLQLCAPLHIASCANPAAAAPVLDKAGAALPSDIAGLAQAEHAATSAKTAPSGVKIELLSSSARGAPNVAALDVVAAEDQGFKELDEISVIVQLAQAQKLVFGRAAPRVTSIMVLLNHSADQAKAAARLEALLAERGGAQPLVVRTFEDLNPFYVQSDQMFDVIFRFIFFLIGAIVLFTVGNTMNTAVIERTVEIGTLRAIGLRQSGVRRLFVIEGFVLGCVGTILGLLTAIAIGALVNRSGLTWLPPSSSERLPLQLRVLAEVWNVSMTAIGLVVIATLSAWWPAWRASNLNVVEALRHA
ncbi:MAG: ABC transporter permease [Burkholderiales bacterium]|nr:ABC transporter permease [Burkholderiales bacterium]